MPIARYAGVGETCPLFSITVASGGAIATSGTLYFSFQLQNRAGYNKPSVSSAIAFTATQKIVITIPESVRKSAWDIRYFIISAGTTSDPSTHVQIARISNYQFGDGISPQTTQVTLPITLELTLPDHISLAGTVANLSNLPAESNRLDGQVRWVTSESKWFEYHADSSLPTSVDVINADVGQWVRVSAASTYVANTTSGVGSDRALPTINPISTIQPPPYPGNSTLGKVLPEWDVKYWIYNETSSNIPEGLEFGIELEYNNLRSPDLLSGLFLIEFLGYAKSDGTLRTTRIADDTEFVNIGGYVPWTPKSVTPFYLPDDVLPGEAIALSVKPFFSVAELNNQVPPGSVFSIIPVIRTQSGDFNPMGKAFTGKGIVYYLGDQYRVVPDLGLGYTVLSGCALVANYDFPIKPARSFSGLAADTADQKIVINGNGGVFTELADYTIQSSEALRATVSTEAGESDPGAWSAYGAITSGQSAQITLTYPCDSSGLGTVRSNYPDVLAGNTKGRFNPASVNIYIQRQDTLEIRKFSGNLVNPGTSQTFTIVDWSTGAIASLPTALDSDFSLYAPGASAIASTGVGNFPTGTNFRVCHSFVYDGDQITAISHDSPPCIVEWKGNFQPPSTEIGTITTLLAGQTATVTNSGSGNAVVLNFGIPRGSSAYTETSESFIQPNIGSNVTVSVLDTAWVGEGQILYLEDGGYYTVSSIPSSTSLVLTNLGYTGNASPTTEILSGRSLNSSGIKGDTGASGSSAYTTTTANYTQPSVNSNVTVSVDNSDWISVGQTLFVNTGGYYLVISKPDSTSVELQNLGYSGNASPTTNITSGKSVSPCGLKGATGDQGDQGDTGDPGVGAFTITTTNYTQPNVSSNVTVSVDDSTWISVGQTLFVNTGGYYLVISKPNSTSVELQNLGYSGNASPTTTITSNKSVSPGGIKGETGTTGSVSSATDLKLTHQAIAPTTSTDESSLYADTSGNLRLRDEANGTINAIALLNKAQQYTKTQGVDSVNLTYGSTVTVDCSLGNKFNLTLTGDVTNFTATNLVSGTFIFNIIEDSTGGRTLAFDTGIFKFPDGGVSAITTTANKRNKVVCDCDGTRMDCTITVFS